MTLHIDELPVNDAYQQKINRDRRVRELRELGYKVKKTVARSQIVKASHIKDYLGVEDDNKYFAVIYIVEGTKEVKVADKI